MSIETKGTLKEETLEKIQELIQINLDSRNGLEEVAKKTDEKLIADMFQEMAVKRGKQAEELQSLVTANFEEPEDSGSFKAAVHRSLIDIRAALGGGAKVMLIEAERGEDQIKDKYEEVLKDEPGSAVSDVLHRHYASVKAAHDRVRDLRDSYKD